MVELSSAESPQDPNKALEVKGGDLFMSTATAEPPSGFALLRALTRLMKGAQGWTALQAALASGHSGTIDGAWGSSAALATAALTEYVNGTLLVVVPSPGDPSFWAEDLTSFSGTTPAIFPAWEGWPLPPNRGKLDPTTTSRLRLLQELTSTPPKVVIATIAAICQPVPLRADLITSGRKLTAGEVIDPAELAEWLFASGYKRVDAVE